MDLFAIEGDGSGIGQAHRNCFVGLLAGQQRIGASLDFGAIGVFDAQELISEGAAPQFPQVCQLPQERLALLFKVWVISGRLFHIVVTILQYNGQKQAKTLKPTFISSTHLNLDIWIEKHES